jgi:hypothetical protein
MKLLIALTFLSYASLLHADEKHPCRPLKMACKTAGFFTHGHEKGNKGLGLDCVKPILAGRSVAGVVVNPSDVQACQAYRANHHSK